MLPNKVLTLSHEWLYFSDRSLLSVGCLFHMGQSVWRHVQLLGLQNKYVNDDAFRLNVNKLIALAFVPIDDVSKAYSAMIIEFDQDADQLLEYYEKTWIAEKKSRGKAIIIYFSHNQKIPSICR